MEFIPYKKAKSVEKVIASIRLDVKTLEEIDILAGKADISRNELINQCIKYALNQNHKDTEENNSI